jgi:hypothetical protein
MNYKKGTLVVIEDESAVWEEPYETYAEFNRIKLWTDSDYWLYRGEEARIIKKVGRVYLIKLEKNDKKLVIEETGISTNFSMRNEWGQGMEDLQVTAKVHNLFARSLKRFCKTNVIKPYCYVIGKDRGVITKISSKLKSVGGCENMPRLTATDLSKRCVELYRQNVIPCGLIRIGDFTLDDSNTDRGESLYEIGNMSKDAIIISFSTTGIKVESMTNTDRGDVKYWNYSIVKSKVKSNKKGGKNR